MIGMILNEKCKLWSVYRIVIFEKVSTEQLPIRIFSL